MNTRDPLIHELARLSAEGADPARLKEIGLDLSQDDPSEVVALLSLPELDEDNNMDVPFSTRTTLKVGVHLDYFRVFSRGSLCFSPEAEHLADWVGRLIHRKDVHVFGGHVAFQEAAPSGGCLRVRLERNEGRTLLWTEGEGLEVGGTSLEFWSRGTLIRRFPWGSEALKASVEVEPGMGLSIRPSSWETGLEVLTEEVEFGPSEWRALLASLCLEGRFREAIGLLADPERSIFDRETSRTRFKSFLKGLAVVAHTDGFVLRPLPVVRGAGLSAEKRIETMAPTLQGIRELKGEGLHGLEQALFPTSDTGRQSDQERIKHISELGLSGPHLEQARASVFGWSHLAGQDFGLAGEVFSSSTCGGEEDPFSLALAARLASHLAEMSGAGLPRRDEVRRTAELWEGLFSHLR